MSQFDLEITISNVQYLLDQGSARLARKQFDAELFLDMASYYRYLGVGKFLLYLDVHGFFQSFYKGARVYQQMLNLKGSYAFDPYYLCKSRGLPLLDAIAIKAFDLAIEISGQMVDTWQPDMEYEEDFFYYDALTRLINATEAGGKLEKSIKEFEACLDGNASSRLNMVKALVENDGVVFQKNLYALIEEWDDHIARQRKSDRIDPYFDKTAANIYIEGVALVCLAQKRGITTENQYKYIPGPILQHAESTFSSP